MKVSYSLRAQEEYIINSQSSIDNSQLIFYLRIMEKKIIVISILLLFSMMGVIAQTAVGTWQTMDDVTGETKSHVDIYERDGKLYGKISAILLKDPTSLCHNCKGDKHNQPVMGMVIVEGLKQKKDYWEGGTILDPENGKTYKCKIYMEGPDKLKVRGYIGFESIGRSQYWTRVK